MNKQQLTSLAKLLSYVTTSKYVKDCTMNTRQGYITVWSIPNLNTNQTQRFLNTVLEGNVKLSVCFGTPANYEAIDKEDGSIVLSIPFEVLEGDK